MAKKARQTDTVVAFQNSRGLEARGTLMRLSRNAVVFEVYNPYSIVQMSEVLSNVRIRRGDRPIYTGRAVVTNLMSTGLMLIVSASLVDPWSDLADLTPGPQFREEVESFIADWSRSNEQLDPGYKESVSNICNFLEELSRWLEHGETVTGVREANAPEQLVGEFVEDVATATLPKLEELFGAFEEQALAVPRKAVTVHKAYAQREVHPLLLCAPYIHRTFTKPLGYAGDYEMVNMILRDRWEGGGAYAKVVNAFPLRVGTAQAHRNRVERLEQMLVSEAERAAAESRPLRALNIGCGPAAEVQRFIARHELADRLDLELIDFNEETLDYARDQLTRAIADYGRETNIRFTHKSIHELLQDISGRREPVNAAYDLVYCAGLFDYLSDAICERLLQLYYEWTLPGGLVVATNVHPENPSRGFMEHLLEWTLVLRDEAQMLELAPQLGQQRVTSEATGINVFLEIRKPAEGEAA